MSSLLGTSQTIVLVYRRLSDGTLGWMQAGLSRETDRKKDRGRLPSTMHKQLARHCAWTSEKMPYSCCSKFPRTAKDEHPAKF